MPMMVEYITHTVNVALRINLRMPKALPSVRESFPTVHNRLS